MATKNIVPRADNEGGLGTSLKKWAFGYFVSIFCSGIKISTGPSLGYVLTSDADGDGTWQAPAGGVSSADVLRYSLFFS